MKALVTFLAFLLISPTAFADITVQDLQHRWAVANYETPEDDIDSTFSSLIEDARSAVSQNQNDPELYIWLGIIQSTYAGKKGGLGALGLVKEARASLEKAMELDDMAMSGSAYTSLGALYYQVPGWPVAFGSNKKARPLLEKALAINPNGIDSNYFYGAFLFEEKEYQKAKEALIHALAAKPRPDRALADKGRREEIQKLIEKINEKTG